VDVSIPNCLAYSAFNHCQPPKFLASGPTMRPIGSLPRRRSGTSEEMCQPAAAQGEFLVPRGRDSNSRPWRDSEIFTRN